MNAMLTTQEFQKIGEMAARTPFGFVQLRDLYLSIPKAIRDSKPQTALTLIETSASYAMISSIDIEVPFNNQLKMLTKYL